MVIANARDAEKWGASIKVGTEVRSCVFKERRKKWLVFLRDKLSGKKLRYGFLCCEYDGSLD
ncbi:hypothetical protein MF1_06180 [Bartonella quintana]|nr:hypothetical protein MF1_06180 [Bartonella quintana]